MSRSKLATVVFLGVGLAAIAPFGSAQEAQQAEREAMYFRYLEFPSYVKGGSIEPHWMADGSSFWYAEGAPDNTVIWKVDPKAGTKTPLFDTARLRKALTPVLGHEPPYQGLPFAEFTFLDGEKAARFIVEDKEFILQLDTYTITYAPALSQEEISRLVPQNLPKPLPWFDTRGEELSPDRRWFASLKDHNLWLRSTADGRSTPLTTAGIEDYEWGNYWTRNWAFWSPDSSKLAAVKMDYRKVPQIPILHWLKPKEEVKWVYYPGAGEPIPQSELFILDIRSKRPMRVNIGGEPDQLIAILGWRPDSSELYFLRRYRKPNKLDLLAASPTNGATRLVLTETQKTSVRGADFSWVPPPSSLFTLLSDGKRFIWTSERDGWNHLYLYDLQGNLTRRLTEGAFPVVEVVAVDEKAGWVYFTAHGDQQRPYDTHLYRVNLDGKGFMRLTERTGEHEVQFAPSKQFFLDTHSSLDRPPVVELRRGDGTLLQILSKANIDALTKELNWKPPEEFVVKAADGQTDLHGILYKPYDFDPSRKYPVIEAVYPGASNVKYQSFIPRGYRTSAQQRAQLGFITFLVDARGTPERGKEFQDVGVDQLLDRVAALKQLAETRPYMDLARVGIYGHSAGGTHTVRALLLYPDVYHVGVASAPVADACQYWCGDCYEWRCERDRNLSLVANLRGKLLLIHGTSDDNVLISQTIRMVDALIRAGKPFDLLVLPDQGHRFTGVSRTYWWDAFRRYFQEHLKP